MTPYIFIYYFRQDIPRDVNLKIGNNDYPLNKQSGDMSDNIAVLTEEITSVVYYKDASGQPAVMRYISPQDKSDKIRNGGHVTDTIVTNIRPLARKDCAVNELSPN